MSNIRSSPVIFAEAEAMTNYRRAFTLIELLVVIRSSRS